MIRTLGFLDVSYFTATLVNKYRSQVDPVLALRKLNYKGDAEDCPILKDWKNARALLTRLRQALAPYNQDKAPQLARAWIESLKTGEFEEWSLQNDEYALGVWRVMICLVPSPGDRLICGGEVITPLTGVIIGLDHSKLHSAVNFGPCQRLHLVADVRRPDLEKTD